MQEWIAFGEAWDLDGDGDPEICAAAGRQQTGEWQLWILDGATGRSEATFDLPAGAQVRVRTGCGRDTSTDLYWCEQGSAVWNNSGDTAFLSDPRGNTVDTRSYR